MLVSSEGYVINVSKRIRVYRCRSSYRRLSKIPDTRVSYFELQASIKASSSIDEFR
jgi:hypothetical protein